MLQKKLVLLLFVLTGALIANSFKTQSQVNKRVDVSLEEIMGIYWSPEKISDDNQYRKGFIMNEDYSLSGYDGCNHFGCSFEYHESSGFTIGDVISTQLACLDEDYFFPSLTATQSFELKGNQLVLHLKNGQQEVFYSGGLNSLKNHPLTENNWMMIQSNHPDFEAVAQENRLPLLKFTEEQKFFLNYSPEKENLKQGNYYAGICNLSEENIFLKYEESRGSLSMPNAEDNNLAYLVLNSQEYQLDKDLNELTLVNSQFKFVFTAIPD